MITIDKAIEIALEAHKNQKDKCGCAYILHPLRVALSFGDDKHFITAVLHDVLEDGDDIVKDKLICSLREDKDILESLEFLNHKKGVPYMEYIKGMFGNKLAEEVKLSDLNDNMDKDRRKKAISIMKSKSDIARFNKKQKAYYTAMSLLNLDLMLK